jgi:CheY-like chemotaxis protein/DNA-binding MarR family transcriptional regulator
MDVPTSPEPRRVLAVDDEPRTLRVVARLLEQAHMYCHTVSSGDAALALLKNSREVDVVVSDLRMPSMDGIEFLRTLRRVYVDRPWLQVILVSGQASLDAAVAAIRIEASDFLFKPIEPKRLRESVRVALERAARLRSAHGAKTAVAERDEVRELEDTARRLALKMQSVTQPGEARAAEGSRVDGREALALLAKLRDTRQTIFGETLMPEPAWEMLTELMRASIANARLSVTSLCLSSLSPTTTALRKIEELEEAGLVRRVPDARDRRRSYVELTPGGILRMRMFLDALTHTISRSQRGHGDG